VSQIKQFVLLYRVRFGVGVIMMTALAGVIVYGFSANAKGSALSSSVQSGRAESGVHGRNNGSSNTSVLSASTIASKGPSPSPRSSGSAVASADASSSAHETASNNNGSQVSSSGDLTLMPSVVSTSEAGSTTAGVKFVGDHIYNCQASQSPDLVIEAHPARVVVVDVDQSSECVLLIRRAHLDGAGETQITVTAIDWHNRTHRGVLTVKWPAIKYVWIKSAGVDKRIDGNNVIFTGHVHLQPSANFGNPQIHMNSATGYTGPPNTYGNCTTAHTSLDFQYSGQNDFDIECGVTKDQLAAMPNGVEFGVRVDILAIPTNYILNYASFIGK